MSSFSFDHLTLRTVAAAVPRHVITLDTSERRVAKFVKQMGIKQVHISITQQTPLDLGAVALEQALAHVGWQAQDLDLVLFDTQSAYFYGGVGESSLLHHYFNLRENCAVFDLPVGCSAFPYSLTTACAMAQNSADIKRIALFNGDITWHKFHSKDELLRQQEHLFGEGTGVVLLEKNNAPGTGGAPGAGGAPITTKLFALGHGYQDLFFYPNASHIWNLTAPSLVMPDGTQVAHEPGDSKLSLYMNGIAIHEFSTTKIANSIKEHYGAALKDFDYYVFHQANRQILQALTTSLELDPAKVLISLEHYGNTSAASALITICAQLAELKRPAHVFNASFGIGLSWGFSDFVLEPGTILPIIETDHHFTEHCLQPVTPEP